MGHGMGRRLSSRTKGGGEEHDEQQVGGGGQLERGQGTEKESGAGDVQGGAVMFHPHNVKELRRALLSGGGGGGWRHNGGRGQRTVLL